MVCYRKGRALGPGLFVDGATFKLLQADPKLMLAQSEMTKARYSKIFGL